MATCAPPLYVIRGRPDSYIMFHKTSNRDDIYLSRALGKLILLTITHLQNSQPLYIRQFDTQWLPT